LIVIQLNNTNDLINNIKYIEDVKLLIILSAKISGMMNKKPEFFMQE
jgi:hypothetical protein